MNWVQDIFANSAAPIELLIYFVVVVLWLVNQVAQKKKRAQRREEAAAEEPESTSGSPFGDFEEEFRELFGGTRDDEPEPEPTPDRRPARQTSWPSRQKPMELPTAQRNDPGSPLQWASGRPSPPVPPPSTTGPRTRIKTRKPPPIRESASPVFQGDLTQTSDIGDIREAADISSLTEDHSPTSMFGSGHKNIFRDAMHHRAFRLPYNSISMAGSSGSLSFSNANFNRKGLLSRAEVQKHGGLRRGMAWRQILGPPRALETTPWPDP
jgi:hypothetical protein